MVLASPGLHKDVAYLAGLIAREQITTVHFVPSMLNAFLEQEGLSSSCVSLKRVICSGEALSFELQRRFFTCLSAELHNLYGPTEAAVDVTFWACERDRPSGPVPIGRPIANTQIYILDVRGRPVPIEVPGELHIGGVGLARGYHKRPELTAEKFISNPFSTAPGARLYRTGDLARFLPSGVIEFLGRLDDQVKIRGFRIELGEIETVLRAHPQIQDVLVMAREDQPGEKRLVAYLIARGQPVPTVCELREFLLKKLPEYMVPATFVALSSFPLTPNGKIDRKALLAPNATTTLQDESGPAADTPVEKIVAGLWKSLLGLERLGRQSNFFDLGGHSLLVTQLVARIRDAFGIELPLRSVFESPTLADLSATIEQTILAEVEAMSEGEVQSGLASPRLDFGERISR